MTRIDRRALFASGAAAALLAATGVSAAPRRGGVLRAALSGAPRAAVWGDVHAGAMMQAAACAIYEGLTEVAADGTLRGLLATEWHESQNGLEWTFALRQGVDVHDGSKLSSFDVATSLSRDFNVSTRENSVVIHLDQPDSSLPYRLAGPEYLIRAHDRPNLGTGLYALHKFEAGRQFIGLRVKQHWRDGQAGWFDRLEFSHFDDADVRADALRQGLVDVADMPEVSDMHDVQRLPDDHLTLQIATRSVAVPVQVGRVWPLDNLRMGERWWQS